MALRPDQVPAVGFNGMAKQRQFAPLPPDWCIKATNCVVDGASRMACRNGWVLQNATPITGSPTIVQLHEFINASGTAEFISATATKLYSGISTPTEKQGALTPTAGNWKFVNFNGYVLGWQASHTPIAYNGSGNFAAITAASGTLPDGNTALAAFGRVWGLDDDKQTIRYSALLDHTRWAVADGGGVIDMRSVWTKGMDEVVAIVSYGSSLVVFGKRHIVIWTDGSGSDIGLSPTNMYVTQVIENVGAVARDAVTLVGELDVAFWSSNGFRSLARTVQETAAPVNDMSPSNRAFLTDALLISNLADVRTTYWPTEGLVLLVHPGNETTYVFDTKYPLQDGGFRMTTWDLIPTGLTASINEGLYFGFNGRFGKYTGFDDNGTAIRFEFESGWVPVVGEDSRRRILKRLKSYVYCPITRTIAFKWWTDFKYNVEAELVPIVAQGDEWAEEEWALMEWGSGQAIHEVSVPLSKECEFLKLGVVASVSTAGFGIMPLTVYSKSGRMA